VTADAVPRWFFVHMHKAAGTTLYWRMRRHFGRDAVYPVVEDQRSSMASVNLDTLRRRLDELGDELRLVTGHFPLCVSGMLGVPFTTITVLRDPVERTLSALRDMSERDPAFDGWPLEKIYEDPIRFPCVIHNHMVKMLAMSVEEMTQGPLTPLVFEDRHLEVACRALDERIDVWGLQEDFESFCDELRGRFGWDLGPPALRNTTTPLDVDDDFRARIARDNRLDVELYRHALDRHERRRTA
jgi:hypothetical protein